MGTRPTWVMAGRHLKQAHPEGPSRQLLGTQACLKAQLLPLQGQLHPSLLSPQAYALSVSTKQA